MYPPPPENDEDHLVADYVEFCCLLSEDGEFSAAEAEADRAREEELDPSVVDEPADAALRIATGLPLEDAEERAIALLSATAGASATTITPLPLAQNEAETSAVKDDIRALLAGDIVQQLTYRAGVFGDGYPFVFDVATRSLRARSLNRRARRVYVFMLAAATLRAFSASERQKLTASFERLAVPVMRGHVRGGEIHMFGTAGDSKTGRYRGKLSNKVQRLAADLRLRLEVDLNDISPRNTGDQGIDAVIWFDTGDTARTGLAVFVQCGCSMEEWPLKLLAAGEDAFAFWFHFYSPVINLVMIPFCFRDATGDWYDASKLKKGVLFDRVRVLLALREASTLRSATNLLPVEELQAKFPNRSFPGRTAAAAA